MPKHCQVHLWFLDVLVLDSWHLVHVPSRTYAGGSDLTIMKHRKQFNLKHDQHLQKKTGWKQAIKMVSNAWGEDWKHLIFSTERGKALVISTQKWPELDTLSRSSLKLRLKSLMRGSKFQGSHFPSLKCNLQQHQSGNLQEFRAQCTNATVYNLFIMANATLGASGKERKIGIARVIWVGTK